MVKPMKSQIPISNDQNTKQVWSAAGGLVIVICLIFVICYLEFYSFGTPQQLTIFSWKSFLQRLHCTHLLPGCQKKPLFYPEEESNPYAFIL
jgi:hypothetical protein